jgi:hypothetical protein
MDDSLVRVSRRVADDHYASILAEREPRSPLGYRTVGYNTLPKEGHVPTVLIPQQKPMLA